MIGVALVAGAFVRLAALGGATQLALFDSTLIYAVVSLALGAFAAGRILGVDGVLETWRAAASP